MHITESGFESGMHSYVKSLIYRINSVIGNACVKMWATNLQRQFTNYLEETETKLKLRIEKIISEISGMYH